jgi:hypothetical protein
MKSKILQLFIIATIFLTGSLSAKAQIKKFCIGKWDFECPSAPEGFNSGIIDIHKDSVFTTFVSATYKFPSIWVKVNNDSLNYKVDINGEEVLYSLKVENKDTLNGKAVTNYGESPLTLTKKTDQELKAPEKK